MEALEKLSAIQKELKAPKSQYNNFGKYKYRSCEDILEAVKPLLDGTPLTISDELMLIGDRYYVKATVNFGGTNGITVSAYAREENEKKGMDASQITGAASSYARKYALNGLFLIDDTKDSDTTNTHGNFAKPETPKAPTQPEQPNDVPDPPLPPDPPETKMSQRSQWTIIAQLAGKLSWTKEEIPKSCTVTIGREITKAPELTFDEAHRCIAEFTKLVEAKGATNG